MENIKGVKKGAWTHEEDKLLRACIHKYGEGKWHLVPERAGLNRCRKSCRLRWLNYLNPNIKRGSFSEDEVDLMLRLHKLLRNSVCHANGAQLWLVVYCLMQVFAAKKLVTAVGGGYLRWSLIAARLPGRTANDVKNYWHTRLGKKVVASDLNKLKEKEKHDEEETSMKTHEVIKPQPRTFAVNHSPWLDGKQHIFANDGNVRVCATPKEGDNTSKEECDAAHPYLGDAPQSSTIWLGKLDEQAGNEKVSMWSLSDQEMNSILEFPNVEEYFNTVHPSGGDYYWDSNLGDFHDLFEI